MDMFLSFSEISGNMAIKSNEICYLNTVVWDDIVKGKTEVSKRQANLKCKF